LMFNSEFAILISIPCKVNKLETVSKDKYSYFC